MKRPLRCILFGHRFYWLDVKRRHHCKRCGVTDVRFVLESRRIRQINPRFGCDCAECEASLSEYPTPPD